MGRKSYYGEHRITVLEVIEGAVLRHAQPPSVRELADAVGVGVATMHAYLTALSEEGLVEWRATSRRSLRLTLTGSQALSSQAE